MFENVNLFKYICMNLILFPRSTCCCCSISFSHLMGWGTPCQACPAPGSPDFDKLCPHGAGEQFATKMNTVNPWYNPTIRTPKFLTIFFNYYLQGLPMAVMISTNVLKTQTFVKTVRAKTCWVDTGNVIQDEFNLN